MGQATGTLARSFLEWTAAGALPLAVFLALAPPEGRAEEGGGQTAVTTRGTAVEPHVCPGPECLPVDVDPAVSSTLSQASTPTPSPESVASTAEKESANTPPSTFWNRSSLTGDWAGARNPTS
jgi:hypothetical protein